MSLRIPIQLPPATAAQPAREAKPNEDAAKAGREFEAILVRQMLASTLRLGDKTGYADMAVEALATAVTSAGGLGLGRAIEAALTARAPHSSERDASSSTPKLPFYPNRARP